MNRPHNIDEITKLGTYEGVFIPTTLNVLSILIYLRFGYIVSQAGIIGSVVLLLLGYSLNFVTTLSLSAIATNGEVKGGGPYYMISRNLGPEFGGSIGIIFYIGQVLNAGLNVAGFVDPLIANFGADGGRYGSFFPVEGLWQFGYKTILLIICTIICLLGPQSFAKSSKMLFYTLLVATLAIPLSTLAKDAFYSTKYDGWYTGPTFQTFKDNLWPMIEEEARKQPEEKPTLTMLFGVVFSAVSGVLAGSSMSGDLIKPSKSIPKGTLYGLSITFALYLAVVFALGTSVSRQLLVKDGDIISDISVFPWLVMIGEFSTSIFSILMGIFGAAKLLQAVASDDIVPLLGHFKKEEGQQRIPRNAILLTYLLLQATVLLPIDSIAVYITMAILMTFIVLNLACFLLRISSAPNFRPSFKYFNSHIAFSGFISCLLTMFFTDVQAALTISLLALILFGVIHYFSEPKSWGDVSQSIIYHQVRKYLLKLKQNHVKYWRPQLLLLIDDPKSSWNLIQFCNFLKKGGLFMIGHVVVTPDADDFYDTFNEISKQKDVWANICALHHIKAFFQISSSSSIARGVRNIFLSSGLGGMRPNITVLGFFDPNDEVRDLIDIEEFPTEQFRKEKHLSCQQWVQIIEEQMLMGSNVCIAKGFSRIDLPSNSKGVLNSTHASCEPQSIDLYPIQLNFRANESAKRGINIDEAINFDTYTLILQLGAILKSVNAWKRTHKLRVIIFVELESEIERERERIQLILEKLRIDAEIRVKCLEFGNKAYDVIIKGHSDSDQVISSKLQGHGWWDMLCSKRNCDKPQNIPIRRMPSTLMDNQEERPALSQGSTRKMYSLIDKSNIGPHFKDDTIDFAPLVNPEAPNSSSTQDSGDVSADDETTSLVNSNTPSKRQQPSNLKFNELPGIAQSLIINQLIKFESKDSNVILSTLPPPEKNTFTDLEKTREYYESLKLLCDDLPPIALVNAQSATVTTDL